MKRPIRPLACLLLLLVPIVARPNDEASAPRGVAAILAEHDRGLIRALSGYIQANPTASDTEQAYMTLFQRVIENDWFTDHEALARRYLAEHPEGAVRPLAQIIATMSRAQAGQFGEALTAYQTLMNGLDDPSQEEFAVNFTDALAGSATRAGEYAIARQVYEILLKRFGTNPMLRQRVQAELGRLELIGKPAPVVSVKDLDGKPFRLADYKGKFVLIDFWATWCAPCLAELPNLQKAYEKYHGRGFEIVGVSLDETTSPLSDFLRDRKLPWRQIHNATCEGDLIAAFAVGSIPASYLVAPDGQIIRLELRGEALGEALEDLLK